MAMLLAMLSVRDAEGIIEELGELAEFGGVQGRRRKGTFRYSSKDQVIALNRRVARKLCGLRPNEDVDDVLLAMIDESGDIAAVQIIETAADKREALVGEIVDGRRKVEPAVKPRFDGVLIGGFDIVQMARLQSANVARDDFLSEKIRSRGNPKAEKHGQHDGGSHGEPFENLAGKWE